MFFLSLIDFKFNWPFISFAYESLQISLYKLIVNSMALHKSSIITVFLLLNVVGCCWTLLKNSAFVNCINTNKHLSTIIIHEFRMKYNILSEIFQVVRVPIGTLTAWKQKIFCYNVGKCKCYFNNLLVFWIRNLLSCCISAE